MLLGYMANEKLIDLHSGTGFDYLFVLRNCKPGIELRNRLLGYHLEGLLQLITLIENKQVSESVTIVGTSYFFNDRTLQKLGFQIEKASTFYRANLFINFIDLCWMYSLSRGKVSMPALWDAKKASIQGVALVAQKGKLEALKNHLTG
jgi:hypothetical protein